MTTITTTCLPKWIMFGKIYRLLINNILCCPSQITELSWYLLVNVRLLDSYIIMLC